MNMTSQHYEAKLGYATAKWATQQQLATTVCSSQPGPPFPAKGADARRACPPTGKIYSQGKITVSGGGGGMQSARTAGRK